MDNEETYEEVQQATTLSISTTQYTIWKTKQGDKHNCQSSTSTPFHTTTKQTATLFTN
jgi:hypothetical protein